MKVAKLGVVDMKSHFYIRKVYRTRRFFKRKAFLISQGCFSGNSAGGSFMKVCTGR
jgi:hypothetical protein